MGGDGSVGLELRHDGVGELFAELDAPLVIAVDAPEDALHEDLVLIQRH